MLKFIDNTTGTGVDILISLRTVGLTQESLKRLRKVKIDDLTITIPCPEDYLITKLKARRPNTFDFSDVMSVLLSMYDKIDWEYLTKRADEGVKMESKLKPPIYEEGMLFCPYCNSPLLTTEETHLGLNVQSAKNP